MIDAFVMLASEVAGEEETSKTAFYVAGGVLAAWAVLVSVVGMTREEWPANPGPARAVMAITALLVAGVMATSIATG